MLYRYDKKNLKFDNVSKPIAFTIGGALLFGMICTGLIIKSTNSVRFLSEETKAIILNEVTREREFSPQKLKSYILELNIRFPHIVYAQACLETGNFKSNIFKTNKNLFGMREAKQRPTTALGTEDNHAYYDSWRESVIDYAMFSAAYLNDIKSERDYFEYLKQNYAEDTNYVIKIKRILKDSALNVSK